MKKAILLIVLLAILVGLVIVRRDDLVAVLGETYGFEFYVTNKEKSYLLVFNHHDILMACGDAKNWLNTKK